MAFGHAHPYHEHEDILDEQDLLLGFKGGLQVTSYTQYTQGGANVVPQSRMRFTAGAAMEFVYDLPRIELDVMWNARGWVNTENTVNFVSFPLLIKFPLQMEKGVEFEIGPGIQPELTLFGADPHNYSMFGVLGSAGLSLDFKEYVVNLELRYDYGLTPVSAFYPGTRAQDLEAMVGVFWHF